MNHSRQRCPRHHWLGPLYQRGPTEALRVEAYLYRYRGGYLCAHCGAVGYRSGQRVLAYSGAAQVRVLDRAKEWNRRCLVAQREGATP